MSLIATFENVKWGLVVKVVQSDDLGYFTVEVHNVDGIGAVKRHYRDGLRDAVILALDIVKAS